MTPEHRYTLEPADELRADKLDARSWALRLLDIARACARSSARLSDLTRCEPFLIAITAEPQVPARRWRGFAAVASLRQAGYQRSSASISGSNHRFATISGFSFISW